jgi:hypothetical protein
MPTNLGAQAAYSYPATFTNQGVYSGYQDGTTSLAIAAAGPTYPRIDLVCQSAQDAEYAGTNNQLVLQVVTGGYTGMGSPVLPAAPASSIVLAQVAVASGLTSIVAGDITNEAPSAGAGPIGPWVPLSGMGQNADLAAGAGFTPAVRTEGAGLVRLRGIPAATGTIGIGATLWTLTSAYRPASPVALSIEVLQSSAVSEWLTVSTAGVVSTGGTGTALLSGNTLALDGLTYTLS